MFIELSRYLELKYQQIHEEMFQDYFMTGCRNESVFGGFKRNFNYPKETHFSIKQ